jgi:hypothetical protein
LGIVLEKILLIRGISKSELSEITSENISKIIKSYQTICNEAEKRILEYIKINDAQWWGMLTDVKELLLNGEDTNSIEIWMVIIHYTYDEEGKKCRFKTPEDDSKWDT